MVVGALFRLRLSRRAQCEKNVETGDEHTMRMRFQSRKSDTSRNKATNFPRNTAPSRQPIFGLWYLTQHNNKAFSLFRFSARFSLLLHLKTRFDAAANRARRAYIHTSTSTTLDRLVRQHRTTHFESSDSATERFCEPSIETLSRARTRAAGGLNRHSPRFFNNAKPKQNARALCVSDVSFSPSSTWARTRLHRSRFPT